MSINYRPAGYVTEKLAAQDVAPRRLSQRDRLLKTYEDAYLGLTDDEAATKARLLGSCYWKRCGELRALGYISTDQEDEPTTRRGMAGSKRIVCWITDEGEQHLKSLEK
jgi:hypothetical protein